MYLIQILLPVYDKRENKFSVQLYEKVREELLKKFDGVTAFTQSPAKGLWKTDNETIHDDIVIYEVMTDVLAEIWWREFRTSLEHWFDQDSILIRSQEIQLL